MKNYFKIILNRAKKLFLENHFKQIRFYFNRWVFPVFWKGLKKDCLDFEDLYRCPKNDESDFVVKQLEKYIIFMLTNNL